MGNGTNPLDLTGFMGMNQWGLPTNQLGSGYYSAPAQGMPELGVGLSNPVTNNSAEFQPSWFDRAFGYADPATKMQHGGFAGTALGAIQGLGNAYMAMQQYGLMKDQLKFQKGAFEKNYAAQRQSINTQLEDRQRARVASNAGAYESVGTYMDRNQVR